MVPQDVMELARRVYEQQTSQPFNASFDRLLVGFQRGPAEIEDIPTEDEAIGACDGTLDRLLDRRRRASTGKEVQIGDKMRSRTLHQEPPCSQVSTRLLRNRMPITAVSINAIL